MLKSKLQFLWNITRWQRESSTHEIEIQRHHRDTISETPRGSLLVFLIISNMAKWTFLYYGPLCINYLLYCNAFIKRRVIQCKTPEESDNYFNFYVMLLTFIGYGLLQQQSIEWCVRSWNLQRYLFRLLWTAFSNCGSTAAVEQQTTKRC